MVDAFGAVTWWGFSPGLDLLKYIDDEKHVEDEDFNFLVVGGADFRHVLKTISRKKRYKKRNLNFFLVENNLEVIARQIMLLSILLEPSKKLGYQEKTQLFLEIFGNSLIRQQTIEYLQMKSTELIKLVTEPNFLEKTFPVINISNLKFKERDQLEAIFKFWRNRETDTVDINQYWVNRINHHLNVRYDSRQNVYDWDYNMKLKEKANIISFREYANWRETGLAFQLREDSAYEFPNRTLASGMIMKKSGEKVARRGYWGDIINSPFISFGIESEEESLFKISNGVHTKGATDVSEFNITAMTYEIIRGVPYVKRECTENKSELVVLEEEEEEEEKEKETKVTDSAKDSEPERIAIDGVKVYLLPLNSVPDLPKKAKYAKLFDLVYFSNSMVHYLTSDIKNIICDDGKLLLETTKFMLDLKEEVSQEFVNKISGMAHAAGFKETREVKHNKDAVIVYERVL